MARIGIVFDFEFLRGAARIRIGHGEHQFAGREREFHGASALARHRRDAIDGGFEVRLVDNQRLVVALRDDAAVIWKRAVDQLRGQHHIRDGEADLGLRQLDVKIGRAVLDQALHLADRLARHDDARHARGACRDGKIDLREAMAVGRDRAQLLRLAAAGNVQINTIEVIARLFG